MGFLRMKQTTEIRSDAPRRNVNRVPMVSFTSSLSPEPTFLAIST